MAVSKGNTELIVPCFRPPYVVAIPCFSSHHTGVRRIRYEVVSAVYHLGSTSRTGHYRSVLMADAGPFGVTDDGIASMPPSPQDLRNLRSCSYVYFLRKLL